MAHATARAGVCFVAAPCNENVAERLAHTLGGLAAHRVDGPIDAERLVLLLDGHELDAALPLVDRVRARRRELWALTPAARGLPLEGYVRVDAVAEQTPGWERLLRAARADAPAMPPREAAPIFLSHAVADEPTLTPVLDDLRRWGLDVFACGDSIAAGTDWEERIVGALRERPSFVLAVSAASVRSVWCAFEAGMARALGKRIALVTLDGTPPPSFVQRHHAFDLARELRARPWLTPRDALASALLTAAS